MNGRHKPGYQRKYQPKAKNKTAANPRPAYGKGRGTKRAGKPPANLGPKIFLMCILIASLAFIIFKTGKIIEDKGIVVGGGARKKKTMVMDNAGRLVISSAIMSGEKGFIINSDDEKLEYVIEFQPTKNDDMEIVPENGIFTRADLYPKEGKLVVKSGIPLVVEADGDSIQGKVLVSILNPREKYSKIVFIDPGHGGSDNGATAGSTKEKDINLDIARRLMALLKEDGGIKAYMTRYDDSRMEKEDRNTASNLAGDLFISIHSNTFPDMREVNGTETLYRPSFPLGFEEYGRYGITNHQLATTLQKNITDALGSKNRGTVERKDLAVLNASYIPAALIEVGYMTNPGELNKLCTEEYRQKAAEGIYRGILEILKDQ